MTENIDRFGRRITYLRVSVTDRCNFRCIYCMPASGVRSCPHAEVLRYEEIIRVVRAAATLGIRKVRLTGGEPLVREGIVDLVAAISDISGIDEVTLTTNGSLLPRYAEQLARAGLSRVNISLDSLRPDRFRQITRLGSLDDTLSGIAAAQEAGLVPIKLNAVVMRGVNDDEVADLASMARDGFQVRFIEWMPIGSSSEDFSSRYVSGDEVRARIEEALGPLQSLREEGPARVYRLSGTSAGAGQIGFISTFSSPFCATCNRIRLTADGKIRPCLLSPIEIDIKEPLRAGATDDEIRDLLIEGIDRKPLGHGLASDAPRDRQMSQIGG
ncbi:MAG TPA: GTP 3',8-cyclase MoaA [Candidatus Acetothermia bacterium]|nr:GTP 3',8-cyclase MoaA [Candidatus Acetothermia bacterium]HEX32732.1 GTP 3',8-cyclase MoaA [Candidatus Acetothermia bacterium]